MAALALKVKMQDLRVVVILQRHRDHRRRRRRDRAGSPGPHGSSRPKSARSCARPADREDGAEVQMGAARAFLLPPSACSSTSDNMSFSAPRYYCDDELEDATLEMAMIARDKVFFRGHDGQPQVHGKFAYHIENEKFVAYLERFALNVGVEIVEDTIRDVAQDEAGVNELHLASGRTESADLYVDCSGFRSLLLGQTLGEPYISYKSSLFCDRAVVGGWERTDEPIHPYTTSESMDSGWCWQIEHVSRINRGYVYSSGFISDEEGSGIPCQEPEVVGETRVVKFVSGRYQRGWGEERGCDRQLLGFVEPLEATALGVIAARSQLVSQVLEECDRRIDPFQVEMYNQSHGRLWDSIRDFLACHYRFNHHLTTPFWRNCQNETDIAGAQPMVEYFQEFGPTGMWGPLLTTAGRLRFQGILMILVGQKVPYKRHYKPTPQEWSA